MVSPISDILDFPKEILMNRLAEIATELNMEVVGNRKDLGLMSFKAGSEIILYAHIVEIEEGKVRISISPGLSNLKERDPSEIPELTIKELINQIRA